MSTAADKTAQDDPHNKVWRSSKLPQPTWIPVKKAAASLGSWRDGPAETPATAAKPPAVEELATAPREVHLVRVAQCPKEVIALAIATTTEETGVNDRKLVLFELPQSRSLMPKSTAGSTPGSAHKDPNSSSPNASGDNVLAGCDSATQPTPPVTPTPPAPAASDEGMGLPEMTLPPSVSGEVLTSQHLFCILCPTIRVAELLKEQVTALATEAMCDVIARPIPSSCTVVVKGIPLSIRHEQLWEEMTTKLAFPPTYMRFHRNDRGLFKNVVYVKYPSAIKAELGRMELDRCTVGGRPLKVEAKKSKPADSQASVTTTPSNTHLRDGRSPQTTPQSGPASHPAHQQGKDEYDGKWRRDDRADDQRVAVLSMLEKAIKELVASQEFEGMSFGKTALSKEESRYLKGLCNAHDLFFDTPAAGGVTVKRRMADRKGISPSLTAIRTPQWHATTPPLSASAAPDAASGSGGGGEEGKGLMFRGIRHWKEARANHATASASSAQQQTTTTAGGLSIHRPVNANEVKAWGAGRGRPSTRADKVTPQVSPKPGPQSPPETA